MKLELLKDAVGPYVGFFTRIHNQPHKFYLDMNIYEVYASCFSKSHPKFNFYGPTIYKVDHLNLLLKCLQEKKNNLNEPQSLKDFIKMILNDFLGRNVIRHFDHEDKEWKNNWHSILKDLQIINQQLIELVELCLKENTTLEVDGV